MLGMPLVEAPASPLTGMADGPRLQAPLSPLNMMLDPRLQAPLSLYVDPDARHAGGGGAVVLAELLADYIAEPVAPLDEDRLAGRCGWASRR